MLACLKECCNCGTLNTCNVVIICAFSLVALMIIVLTILALRNEHDKNEEREFLEKKQSNSEEVLRLLKMYTNESGEYFDKKVPSCADGDYSYKCNKTETCKDGVRTTKFEVSVKPNDTQNNK